MTFFKSLKKKKKHFFVKIIFFIFFLFFINQNSFAAKNENSAGLIIGLFQATYGKFSDIASTESQPAFSTYLLVLGGDVTFMRSGFFTGGRILYGSTTTSVSSSSTSTSASLYQIENIGAKTGYGFGLGIIDFKLGSYFGVGDLNFSTTSSSQSGIVIAQYLYVEPFLNIGIPGGKYFKPSMQVGYHLTFPYKVTTYGDSLMTNPSTDATVGGIFATFQLNFGDFGK